MTIQEIKKELFENTAEHIIVRFTDSKGRRYAFVKAWTLFKVDSWETNKYDEHCTYANRTKYYIDQDKFIAAIKRVLKKGEKQEVLEQQEVVKIELFARKCDCCGKGMNDGYYLDGEYICSDECFDKTYTSEERTAMDVGGDDSDCYWTEWNDESDVSYKEINGVLTSINEE